MKRAIGLFVTLLVVSACGQQVGADNAVPSRVSSLGTERSTTTIDVDDPLATATLKQIAHASDLVVVGTLDAIGEPISIASDKTLGYSLLDISVAQAVRGNAPSSLQVSMLTTIGDDSVTIPGRCEPIKGEPSLWMLQRMDPRFGLDAYVLSSVAGCVATNAGRVVLPAQPDHVGLPVASSELAAYQTLDEVLAAIGG